MSVEDAAPGEALAADAAAEVLTIRSGKGRATILGFATAHFSHHVTNSLLNPLLPLIRDTFALSYTQSGFATAAYSLSVGLANAPMGVLADRVGARVVLAAGLVGIGITSVALALSGAYWQLLIFLILMGIVSGTYHAPAVSLLTRAFPERIRGGALGLHTTGGHLAFFAAPLVAGWFALTLGTWRAPYLAFAIAPIASGVALWLLAPSGHIKPESRSRLAALRELVAVARRVGSVVGLSIFFQVGYAAFLAFLSIYLVDSRGLDIAAAAALFAVPQGAGLVGAPFGGWLSDRIGRRAVIAIGLSVLGPAIWLFTVTPTAVVWLPLLVIGIATSMRLTVTEVLVSEAAPAARRATVLGTYYLLSAEIGGLAAPVLGAIATEIGISAAFSWTGVALAALSAVVALLALTRRL